MKKMTPKERLFYYGTISLLSNYFISEMSNLS